MSYDSYIENINESRRLMNNMINLMNNQERNMRIIINNNNRNNNRNNNSNNNRNIWDNYFLVSDPFNYSRNTSIQLTREELNRLNSINVTRPLNNSSTSNIPTRNQISRATNTTLFSNIVNPSNTTCPISRDRFNSNDTVTQIIPCGHIFTSNNLQQWFTYHSVCPMCRYDIRNYIPSLEERTPFLSRRPTMPPPPPPITGFTPSLRTNFVPPPPPPPPPPVDNDVDFSDIENPFETRPSANINPSQQSSHEIEELLGRAIENVINSDASGNSVVAFEYSVSIDTNSNDTNE